MTDIVEFIRARLDDDERIARAAGTDQWEYREHPADRALVVNAADDEVVVFDEGWPSEDQAQHIARHDPARVLREVALRRSTLDIHKECGDGGHGCLDRAYLAAVWSGHPDYDQAWAIEP